MVESRSSIVETVEAIGERALIARIRARIPASPGWVIIRIGGDAAAVGPERNARAGDEIYVTGSIGGAAAGLNALRAGLSAEAALGREGGSAEAGQKYLRPEPRLRVGILLGRNRAARACIDLSDGLADAVRQVAEASGVGAVIEAHALPIQPKTMSVREAITGGEDYELLFTVSPKMRGRLNGVRRLVKDLPITKIGIITADRALLLDIDGRKEELPLGFDLL